MIPYLLGLATLPALVALFAAFVTFAASVAKGGPRAALRSLVLADYHPRYRRVMMWREMARNAGRTRGCKAWRHFDLAEHVDHWANKARWYARWAPWFPLLLSPTRLWHCFRLFVGLEWPQDVGTPLTGRWEKATG